MEQREYLLRVELADIEPVIFRRFVVPGSITLDRLHDVIQIVMGWMDNHLFEFEIGKKRYTEAPENKRDGLECGKYRLVDLVKREGRTFLYHYDFGEGWEHMLTLENSNFQNTRPLEKIGEADDWFSVICLEGARACPPEDVGGVPGYLDFCEAMSDPRHPDHEEFKEWYAELLWHPDEYNSEEFDRDKVNLELLKYLRLSRDRQLPW